GEDGATATDSAWQVTFTDAPGDAPLPAAELALQAAPDAVAGRGAGADATIHVRLAYDAGLFQAATAERHLACWQTLLRAMCDADDQDILRLPLLDAEQRRQAVERWNHTAVPYPRDVCLHTLIEAQVARTPDAIAVVAGGERMSYAALNAAANRLAHHLRALGVRPGDRSGVGLERGWRMVVGLLAVLKSGGAYVPMDPAYPRERLAHMLGDSAPKVLLTERGLGALVEALQPACPCLALDEPAAAWDAAPDTDPDPAAVGLGADHLAYVIYTSGSTGLPKGAMNAHSGIVNRLLWMQDE